MAFPAQSAPYIPVELYLQGHGDYEADVDYVDDHVEERHLGTRDHSKWQQAVQHWFLMHTHEWNTIGLPELRIRIGPRRYRVADVAILDRDAPDEQVPSHPPLAIFEILSPEDRLSRVRVRLADYAAMGVPEIWLIDPAVGSFRRYADGKLAPQTEFTRPDRGITFSVEEIAKLAR